MGANKGEKLLYFNVKESTNQAHSQIYSPSHDGELWNLQKVDEKQGEDGRVQPYLGTQDTFGHNMQYLHQR